MRYLQADKEPHDEGTAAQEASDGALPESVSEQSERFLPKCSGTIGDDGDLLV